MAQTVDVLGTPHTYELTASTDGVCLVFVHGWLLSREYWRPLVSQLQEYPCLLYDLRGFGTSQLAERTFSDRSDGASAPEVHAALVSEAADASHHDASSHWQSKPSSPVSCQTAIAASPYSPAAYAQDLTHLLKSLGIEKAWVIGHSLGGSIGLWSAFQSPERICGCICVNSGGGIYLKEEFEKFRNVGRQLVRFRPQWLGKLPLLDIAMARMNVAQPLQRQWGRRRLLDLLAAQPEAALGSLLDSTTEEEVHQLPHVVSHLTQPAYFVAGDRDDIMEPQYVNHLASFHHLFRETGQNVVELENCGHFAMIEQPERLAATIKSILGQHSDIAA
ncbi:MAG: alpha/beta hydrolase [Elainellaceae cyanobacterium]